MHYLLCMLQARSMCIPYCTCLRSRTTVLSTLTAWLLPLKNLCLYNTLSLILWWDASWPQPQPNLRCSHVAKNYGLSKPEMNCLFSSPCHDHEWVLINWGSVEKQSWCFACLEGVPWPMHSRQYDRGTMLWTWCNSMCPSDAHGVRMLERSLQQEKDLAAWNFQLILHQYRGLVTLVSHADKARLAALSCDVTGASVLTLLAFFSFGPGFVLNYMCSVCLGFVKPTMSVHVCATGVAKV